MSGGSSEMVERVARAICLAESCHDGVAMHHLEAARAAIEAMMDGPSDATFTNVARTLRARARICAALKDSP